ncbi:MAG: OmpA family protein [Pseudomonadota bacterium]
MKKFFTLIAIVGFSSLFLFGCAAKKAGDIESSDGKQTHLEDEQIDITPLDLTEGDIAEDSIVTGDSNQLGGDYMNLNVDEIQSKLELSKVMFAFDEYTLSDSTKKLVEEAAEKLKGYPGLKIKVVGHCDKRGSNEYNLALGFKRSTSITNYLVNLGIEENRVKVESMGEESPIDNTDSEEAYNVNRRGEFLVEK